MKLFSAKSPSMSMVQCAGRTVRISRPMRCTAGSRANRFFPRRKMSARRNRRPSFVRTKKGRLKSLPIEELFKAVDLDPIGPIAWNSDISEKGAAVPQRSGVYVVSISDPLEVNLDDLPRANVCAGTRNKQSFISAEQPFSDAASRSSLDTSTVQNPPSRWQGDSENR
jgi:hypothetical protein